MSAATAGLAAFASPEAISALFSSAASARAIILAVSGGPDSMALLHLAARWRDGGKAPALSVATVDHGLRPEARGEAEQVARWSAALGFSHAILTWTGAKPKARLQEKAREARYSLLEAHAKACGADVILLGHHQDDQAETVLLRLLRGSGIDGLAGMAPLSRRGELTLCRPLLDWPKARLVALCVALNQPYFDDPSNADPRFARSHLRKLGPVLAEQGLDAQALSRLAERARRMREAINICARDMLSRIVVESVEEGWRADVTLLASAPEEIVLRVLGALVAQAAAPGQTLKLDALERLCAGFSAALASKQRFSTTLAGLTINLDAEGWLALAPERTRKRGSKITGRAG